MHDTDDHAPRSAATRSRSLRILAAGLLLTPLASLAAAEQVVCAQFETAGIDARVWDTPRPGAMTADAVHRRVLLRFPGAARQIADALAGGKEIAKAELVLRFDSYQFRNHGYDVQFRKEWEDDPPNWHLAACVLRKPWAADAAFGPTFNAWINGAGYWKKYGAQDTAADRFPAEFPPVEVSQYAPEGRLDVTAVLTSAEYGADLGTRLRVIEEQGFILRKWEMYDARYRDWSAYEWNMNTGGLGLTFKEPHLVVTLREGEPPAVTLPQPADIAKLAEGLKTADTGGSPSLRWPTAEELRSLSDRHAVFQRRPDHATEKQWERILELRHIGGGVQGVEAFESGDLEAYKKALAQRFLLPPRAWRGWGVADELLLYHYYHAMWPAYFVDYAELFWHLWLMEEIPDEAFTYAQGEEARDWFKNHGDWRGRASFFRKSWTHREGTMNFNHTAAMGALLGGAIIGAERAMADGRHGLENFPLRHWSYQDGSGQEMLDHYYFSITVSAQKMFIDFGPTELDRLMGRMAMDHTLEMLASAYQPATRRCVGASGRARMPGILGIEQDGIYHPLHILANDPVLLHTDQPYGSRKHDLPLWGYDYPPGRAALQSIAAPWHEAWFGNVIDRKPIPFTETATDTGRGLFRPALRKTTYHGRHHSLASMDLTAGTVPVTAQWTHRAETVDDSDQISTLILRYALNDVNVTRTGGGHMGYQGSILTLQHRNKAVVFTKPRTEQEQILKQIEDEAKRREKQPEGLKRLSTVIALWSYRDTSDWKLYRNGLPLGALPATAKAGDVITLHDGVSYLGVIPLPATDLGRSDEVVIRVGEPGPLGDSHKMQPITPKLLIESFNLQRDTPLAENDPLWDEITRHTYGGFVIETGDIAEYGSFDAFQRHMQSARAEVAYTRRGNGWALDRIWHCHYRSADDILEFKVRTDYVTDSPHGAVAPGQQTIALYERRVNGRSPFPPEGIDRDTTLSQQGTCGALRKRGARLLYQAGRTGYLLVDPVSGTTLASNPLPEESLFWALTTPEGVELLADGQLGLARVIVQPAQGRIVVDHALKEGQRSDASARALVVFGLVKKPTVEHFGKTYTGEIARTTVDGKPAWIIPLRAEGCTDTERTAVPQRIAAARERIAKYATAD